MSERRMPVIPALNLDDVSLDTRAICARPQKYKGKETIPIVTPIYHSSTFRLEKVDDFLGVMTQGGQIYSRLGNFTTDAAECAINALEEGAGTLMFSSGMSAISTVLIAFLKSGDHVVLQNPIYSNTLILLRQFSEKFGIDVSFVSAGCSVEEFKKNVKPNTKMLFGETPCNPNMTVLDLEEFGKLGQSLGIMTVVDSTFGSCYLQQPIKYGIDISIHSCSKYIGGHSDIIAGCATTKTLPQWKLLKKWLSSLGGVLSPHVASLLIRGLKTLPIRMERHSKNGLKVAEYLEKHPKIEYVYYPGLPSHPQHDIAKKQMRSFGGMIRADVKGGEQAGRTVVETLKIVQLAVSLGGVESVIEQPYTMTHGPFLMTDEEREHGNVTPGGLRISIGLEDPDDLIKDFEQALRNVDL